MRTDIDLSKANKHYMGIIFIDFKRAFNYVNIRKLLELLLEYKIPLKFVAFIANIMISRVLHGYSSGVFLGTVETNSGCPQGSVLSPLLFNLYVSKINYVFTHHVKSIGLADDFNFYASNKDLNVLLKILEENFKKLKD